MSSHHIFTHTRIYRHLSKTLLSCASLRRSRLSVRCFLNEKLMLQYLMKNISKIMQNEVNVFDAISANQNRVCLNANSLLCLHTVITNGNLVAFYCIIYIFILIIHHRKKFKVFAYTNDCFV